MEAIVAGGGVAGTATANALRRIGSDVTLYETHSDPAGQVGSFLSLASNGLRALEALGCLDQVQQAGFAVPTQRMWSSTGRLLAEVPRGRLSGGSAVQHGADARFPGRGAAEVRNAGRCTDRHGPSTGRRRARGRRCPRAVRRRRPGRDRHVQHGLRAQRRLSPHPGSGRNRVVVRAGCRSPATETDRCRRRPVARPTRRAVPVRAAAARDHQGDRAIAPSDAHAHAGRSPHLAR